MSNKSHILGVPVAEIDLCWFSFTPSYDGCIHHAVRPDGMTFCGRSTSHAEFGGRTLGDDHGDGSNKPSWPSCLKCAASLRKHGLKAPHDDPAGTVLPSDHELVGMVHDLWNASLNLESGNIILCMASKMRVGHSSEFRKAVKKQLDRLVAEGKIRRARFLPGRPIYTIS